MKISVLKITFASLFLGLSASAYAAMPVDSTRSETKDGKTYTIHKVDAGQTLFAVMRKYKTTIQALKDANPGMKDNLVTGQLIRVPRAAGQAKTVPSKVVTAKTEEKPKPEEKIVIKPTPKETEKVATKPKPEPEEDKIVIAPQNPQTNEKPKAEEKSKAEDKPKTETEAPEKETEPKTANPIVVSKTGFHKVEAGQSLYGVAVKYGVLMADIRRWNNLSSDQLRAGQELAVSEIAYRELLKRAKTDSIKLADTKPATPTEKPMIPPPVPTENSGLPDPKIVNTGKRIIESGMAEVIDVADNSNKYLALHRTAPIGSLIQVKNASNSQTVWVKVVGKLPSISVNDRIIIKLSAKAYEKLSPTGKRFLSEISYLSE